MISLVGILLYLLTDLIYDYAGMGQNTNWSIFYFSMVNLSFTLVAFDIMFKEASKTIKYTAFSMGLYILFYIIWELSFINVPFDEYMMNVNSTKVNIVAGSILSVLLLIITIRAWVRRHSKKSVKF